MDHPEDSGAPGEKHADPPLGLTPEEVSAATVFAGLAVELYDSHGIEQTIDAVVAFALQALGCSHAGVAIAGRGRKPEIPAVTDPVVAGIYREQLVHGNGPMTVCMTERAPVLVTDTALDGRWPEWAAHVRELGVRSVFDVPLKTAEGPVGVLGLYSAEPDAFSTDDQAIAHILARHAAVAIANARHDATMLQAIDARKLVGQAMGILMERFDLDADRAFELLKRYSQDHNLKLRDVAKTLVETRRLPDHQPAGDHAP
ncbi:GAF and ANTAR domain-containing protein [Kribbella sp. NPDC051620]|uniref:GAF and ANTAR domain-containing protein n=1 Tax=Kribbella sp. NPDC051620 TaxID=3364120 RepID=UPI0037920677